MRSELRMERMTSPEVAEALAEGYTTVVVPCGAIEQHGPHLPMFMDSEHGDRLGEEVARRLPGALVAPTIRVGCSEHHMAFRGTVSLSTETFMAVCRDYCSSLGRHGFRRILFLPTHGGNFRPLREGLAELDAAAGIACTVEAYTDLMGVLAGWRQAVDEVAGLGERVGGHADIAETSIMHALHPGLVRQELAEAGFQADPSRRESLVDRILREGFDTVTPNGILGDARGARADIGERCIEWMADAVAAAFAEPAT